MFEDSNELYDCLCESIFCGVKCKQSFKGIIANACNIRRRSTMLAPRLHNGAKLGATVYEAGF
jgi:hypothetical protein